MFCFAFVVQNLSCCGKLHLKRENGVQKKILMRIRQKILQEVILRIQKTVSWRDLNSFIIRRVINAHSQQSELVNEKGAAHDHGVQEGSMTLDNAGYVHCIQRWYVQYWSVFLIATWMTKTCACYTRVTNDQVRLYIMSLISFFILLILSYHILCYIIWHINIEPT